VISTIHQPGSEAFACFDRLILMCDGHIVYQGEARMSARYFKNLNYQCPIFANPSDYFMKVLTINYPKQVEDDKKV
jgi:ABC-type multidrug transport system ATPase subunit